MDAAKLEKLLKPILDLYNEIETDLLLSVASRFDTYDSIGGTLDWYIKKLEQMGAFNKDNLARIIKYSPATKKKIQELLESVSYQTMLTNGTMNLETLMASYVNKRILEDAVASLEEEMKLINTKAVESASKAYMDVLTKAYIETSSGAYSYNESIRRALQSMAERGIAGATYQRGSKTVQYSLEGTVRRDVLTKSHQLSVATQMQNMKELGHNLVYVSQHIGARTHPTDKWANHAGWQGKVYMVEGSSEKYENLEEATGYGDIVGLAGVNCRHNISSYIEGVTKIPDRIDEEENERIYKLSQEQRALERNVRKDKKELAVAQQIGDADLEAKYRKKLDDSEAALRRFVSSHEELKMDYSRTQTVEQLTGGSVAARNTNTTRFANIKKGKPMTFQQADGRAPNPNHGKARGYSINCQSCVVAYEARRRGYNVETLPMSNKNTAMRMLSHDPDLAWIDPKTGEKRIATAVNSSTPKAIVDEISSAISEKERYTLKYSRTNSRSGHIVSLEKVGKELRLYDPQVARIYPSSAAVIDYLRNRPNITRLKMLRVDDLDFNTTIVDNILKEAKKWRRI